MREAGGHEFESPHPRHTCVRASRGFSKIFFDAGVPALPLVPVPPFVSHRQIDR
jgi:hypothetical protein